MLQLSALIFLFLSSNTLASDEQLISIINLPDEEIITVDSIIVTVINALENAKTHTTIEKKLFALGNKLRYITKKNTIKKYLLFKERDSISKTILIESERNLRRQAFFADAIIKLKKKIKSICKCSYYSF